MSEETNLIDANVIDDISNDLAVEFDDILEVEDESER
jgi:hypothetical protein